jgi:hypothetical protein
MSLDPSAFPKVLTIYLELSQYPILASRVRERMRQELFKRGVITQEAFEAEVRDKALQSQKREGLKDPYRQEPQDIWLSRLSIIRDNLTDFYFAYNLPHERFMEVVRETLAKRVPQEDILPTIHPELAPWDMLFAQGEAIESMSPRDRRQMVHHLKEIKVVLIKAMISDHLDYVGIAKDWFDIADLQSIRASRVGRGKIGGKAAGIMLAECILRKSADEKLLSFIHIPQSWFLGADVFYIFTQLNGFIEYTNQKYKAESEIRSDYPAIQERLSTGRLPDDIIEDLRAILDQVGNTPLIVRSSSLLEDSFGTSFAGKYESVFCPNQKGLDSNLTALLNAIRRVYASVYSPDVLLYRRRMGLTDYDERMAILIQEVQGRRAGRYFMPDGAGVALSRNQFRWSQRIDREAGFLRLVWGLGTRAVEQLGGDHPRLVALSHPNLRPEADPKRIAQFSQQIVDLIDLEENTFRSMPISEVIHANTPSLRWLAQPFRSGHLETFMSLPMGTDTENMVITFDGLLSRTAFPELMRQMLRLLQTAYRNPVDTEFTVQIEGGDGNGVKPMISLLQCRPQSHLHTQNARLPEDVAANQRLFTTKRLIPDGYVDDVRYAVYVSPQGYRDLPSLLERKNLARMVGRINHRLEGERFILLGPGRWGSNNPNLGIPISYSEIHNARALIEIVDDETSPEPSYGTHFFQDLVEAQIYPLAVALQDKGAEFNRSFFEETPNALKDLLPNEKKNLDIVRVIDIPAVTDGAHLVLVMDGDEGTAMAYLQPPLKEAK